MCLRVCVVFVCKHCEHGGRMQVRLRKLMIEMVLGTDMKQHVAIISRFQTTLQVKLHSRMMTTAGCSSAASAESLAVKFEDPSDRCMLLQVTYLGQPPNTKKSRHRQHNVLSLCVCVCVCGRSHMQ